MRKLIPFALILAVIFTVAFYPRTKRESRGETVKKVIRVWNVDTFEGGKGSRTNFLKQAASEAEQENRDVCFLVTSYTEEGANRAFAMGEKPDILSFGIGLSVSLESSLPLPYSFSGGETDDGCFAYPWCRGEYYLFSLSDNFEEEGNVAISSGGNNLVEVAAALHHIDGDKIDSLSAYVTFLNKQYRYLLGTQRDICRFMSRNVTVYKKPLNEFCDLYQYISVLSSQKREECFAFVETLLSEKMQNKLESIGMFKAEKRGALRTVSAFTDSAALNLVRDAAKGDEAIKNLDKFLKNI